MPRRPRWIATHQNGYLEVKLSSWKYFPEYINQEMLEYTTYIYRGHGNSSWKLEPTLDRIIKDPDSPKRIAHLESFKFATRGRRGPTPPGISDENDWWALGQHHGLATPLLDWSESPFVALYFAATIAEKEKTKEISIFAVGQSSIEIISNKIKKDSTVKLINRQKPTVKIIRPMSDENSRLVSQRGLFTRGPNNMDLESWFKNFNNDDKHAHLIKITTPTTNIKDCLKYLNRMNINHSTLFPDLMGASEYCNTKLRIETY
ncbi:MAG: hypothetical protein H6R07_1830 [Proteobacteria bacterium]|nr:hypothetical protein [Pseudomonadota bacterium]